MENLKSNKLELDQKGWTLIKNVFKLEEVLMLRQKSVEFKKSKSKGDLLSDEYFSGLILNKKIIEIGKSLLNDQLAYFGESSIGVNSIDKRISHGFHKDNAVRLDSNSKDFTEDYNVIRFGIYLQDHKNYSEGLIIRDGSHKMADFTSGKKTNVESEAGDVIVWKLTTTHSGNAKRTKVFKSYVFADDGKSRIQKQLYYRIPKSLEVPPEKDRIAIFLTFGLNDDSTNRHIEYLKGRNYMVELWNNSNWSKETFTKADLLGLNLIRVKIDTSN